MIPPTVIAAAAQAHSEAARRGDDTPMLTAAFKLFELLELGEEYAVPCLGAEGCRTIFTDRAEAEAHAAKEGGVIESRVAGVWRPVT